MSASNLLTSPFGDSVAKVRYTGVEKVSGVRRWTVAVNVALCSKSRWLERRRLATIRKADITLVKRTKKIRKDKYISTRPKRYFDTRCKSARLQPYEIRIDNIDKMAIIEWPCETIFFEALGRMSGDQTIR